MGPDQNRKRRLIPEGLWKFLFWPFVWLLVYLSAYMLHKQCACSDRLGAWSVLLGLAIMVWALAVHIVAGKSLKRFGHSSGHKSIWPDRLVTSGIYSCMRHPQHLGLALLPLGAALVSGYLSALLASGWAVLAAFFFVLVIEEPECLQKFGKDYCRYMKDTPAFCLHPRCLKMGWKWLKSAGSEES